MTNLFWRLRASSKAALSAILYRVAPVLNSKMVQWCDGCGKSWRNMPMWWDYKGDLWNEVVGHEEGCYCPDCFKRLADKKNICIEWVPRRVEDISEQRNREDKLIELVAWKQRNVCVDTMEPRLFYDNEREVALSCDRAVANARLVSAADISLRERENL
jgi:hypothetical protein